MKHRVDGLEWYWVGRGEYTSEKPGVNGPVYRLHRDIHAKTGRHYWEAWWCPEGRWQPIASSSKFDTRRPGVFLGRAHGRYTRAARFAEMHQATLPDAYYERQM